MVTLLPADKYIVVNKTILTEEDKKILVSLYEPIIGAVAVSLFLTLWRDLDRYHFVSADYTHHHLMTLLKVSLEDIKKSRKALEGMGLLKTFYKAGEQNQYVYELYSPMTPREFFSNPIFNVVLYNNVGAKEYDDLKSEFQTMNISLKDYDNITSLFDDVFESSNILPSFEAVGKESSSIQMHDQVDFDLIISSLPKGVVHERTFTKKVRELINELALVYNIDTLKMIEIIRLSINENGYLDRDNLRVQTRKYYQYNNYGKLPTLVYRSQPEYLKSPTGDMSKKGQIIEVFENMSPYDFLSSKYKGVAPTNIYLKILEYLLVDLELKPAVVNVLIDYVLKKNNNKLNNAFIETIAGQWKRLNIKTAKEAMEVAEKEHKKYVSKLQKETKRVVNEKMPVWFNEQIEKESLSVEEEKELDEMLKKYHD